MSTHTHWFWSINGREANRENFVPTALQARYVHLADSLLFVTQSAKRASNLAINRNDLNLLDGTRITAVAGDGFSQIFVDVLRPEDLPELPAPPQPKPQQDEPERELPVPPPVPEEELLKRPKPVPEQEPEPLLLEESKKRKLPPESEPIEPEQHLVKEMAPARVPYLWIGVKQLNNRDDVSLHVCLFEPDAKGGEHDAQVISNRGHWVGAYGKASETLAIIPVGSMDGSYQVDEGAIIYSQRAYLIDRSEPGLHSEDSAALIYDPLDQDKPEPTEWDVTIVLDPCGGDHFIPLMLRELSELRGSEGQPMANSEQQVLENRRNQPTDDRRRADGTPLIPAKAIDELTGNAYESKLLGAEYALKIMAYGDDCLDLAPTQVQIEVHTLKLPHTTQHTYTISIDEQTEFYRGLLPGGYYPSDEKSCTYAGNNPHRKHWWQGAVLCSPYGGSKETDYHLPNWGFDETDNWPSRQSLCQSAFNKYVVEYKVSSIMATTSEFEGLLQRITLWKYTYGLWNNTYQAYEGKARFSRFLAANYAINPNGQPPAYFEGLLPNSGTAFWLDTGGSPKAVGTSFWASEYRSDELIWQSPWVPKPSLAEQEAEPFWLQKLITGSGYSAPYAQYQGAPWEAAHNEDATATFFFDPQTETVWESPFARQLGDEGLDTDENGILIGSAKVAYLRSLGYTHWVLQAMSMPGGFLTRPIVSYPPCER